MTRVADEAWIAAALLHREHPEAEDFSLRDIHDRAKKEFRHDPPSGVWQHIVSHAVASNPPDPARIKMFHNSGRGRRRLFRPGDPSHPKRTGKTHPEKRDVDHRYHALIDWYLKEYSQVKEQSQGSTDPRILLHYIGIIPAYDLQKMSEAIRADTERVDGNEW